MTYFIKKCLFWSVVALSGADPRILYLSKQLTKNALAIVANQG